jgi:hypothetical protein
MKINFTYFSLTSAQHARELMAPLVEKITHPVSLPSQAGAKGNIIQSFFAPAMLGAANAQAVRCI